MKAYAEIGAERNGDVSGSKAHNHEYLILVMKGQLMTSSNPCLQRTIGKRSFRHTEPLALFEELSRVPHQKRGSTRCCVLQRFEIQSVGTKPWHLGLLLVVLAVADSMEMNGCHTGDHSSMDPD